MGFSRCAAPHLPVLFLSVRNKYGSVLLCLTFAVHFALMLFRRGWQPCIFPGETCQPFWAL